MADSSETDHHGGEGESINAVQSSSSRSSNVLTEGTVEQEGSEKLSSPVDLSTSNDNPDEQSFQFECPICLQPCVHPVELPCKHIFCFLCIKGVAMQGPHGRCAICRSNIPHSVLTHPRLKDVSQLYKQVNTTSGFVWYYEARQGGWWTYDIRSMQELEKAFNAEKSSCQLLIAGHLYEIDFVQMVQYRLNNRNQFRRIKRDLASAEKRGIAGIRLSSGESGNSEGSATTSGSRRGRGSRHASSQAQPQTNTSTSQHPGSLNQTDSSQSYPISGTNSASDEAVVISDSGSEGEENEREEGDSYDPDDIEDEDDDMEFVEEEEEELGESNDEEEETEEELRDGARAPTRRSDRSNSSTNQTPPPNGVVNGSSRNQNTSPNSNPNGRAAATHGARNDRSSAGSRSNHNCGGGACNSLGGSASRCGHRERDSEPSPVGSSGSSSSPQLTTDGGMQTVSGGNIRLSPVSSAANDLPPNGIQDHVNLGSNNNFGSSRNFSSSITTTSGLTCLLIGPGVRITLDQDNSNGDEIL